METQKTVMEGITKAMLKIKALETTNLELQQENDLLKSQQTS